MSALHEHAAHWCTSSRYCARTLTTSPQRVHLVWSSCWPVDLLVGLPCPCCCCSGCSQWLRGPCCWLSRPWLSCQAVLFQLPVLHAAPHALLPFSPIFIFIPTLPWSFFICSHSWCVPWFGRWSLHVLDMFLTPFLVWPHYWLSIVCMCSHRVFWRRRSQPHGVVMPCIV